MYQALTGGPIRDYSQVQISRIHVSRLQRYHQRHLYRHGYPRRFLIMATSKRVEFDAHKVVKKPTKVAFKTKDGEKVRFTAEKPTTIPVHVSFRAKT